MDWSSEDRGGEKAKAREQNALIDFNPPNPDSRQTMDLETADDLPMQNLSINEDKKEEELPEVTDVLVPPPEASAVTPVTKVTKLENIMEEDSGGLTDQEQTLQRKEGEYAIYIGMPSDEEESNTETDT